MSNFTFHFAWVTATDTTFNPSFARTDENIFSFRIEHEESQIPKLIMQVRNPRIGLIAPGRNYWAWLSYDRGDGHGARPLFFGRLVGIPTDILGNVVEMQLIARPSDYIPQKQRVAETLKVLPNYDPVFVEVAKRDDPDSILEGWSLLYHVDRFGFVSASDILIGEAPTISFHTTDVFYDSVKMKLLQSPLQAVNVKAEVTWNQQARGAFHIGAWSFPTLGNEAFVGQWPQTGSGIGAGSGGYYATVSWAGERDPSIEQQYLSNWTGTSSYQYEYKNLEKQHAVYDTMSISISESSPITATGPEFHEISVGSAVQAGYADAYHTDENGDLAPINIPTVVINECFCWRAFDLSALGKTASAYLSIGYEANRQRTERIDLTVIADTQPILIDPLVIENTETINVKGTDLGLPLIDFLNWDSVAGLPVAAGQIIFPDNPLVPGQASAQIAIAAGTAGTVEPVFSNVAGVTTVDGTVTWSSLGVAAPTEMAQDWVSAAPVALGTMIIPKTILGTPDRSSLLAAGMMNYPPMGVPVAQYQIISEGTAHAGSLMSQCVIPGILSPLTIAPAQFTQFYNPSGMYVYICVKAGTTDLYHSTFNETIGARTTDGTVTWQNVGLASVPIGGWPGYTPARSYFPSDRGQQSLQNLIARARAKLRKRARAVEISFETKFEAADSLDCRSNAGIADVRLPGGQAYGKVIAYKLIADGDSGRVYGTVNIGCTIGNYVPGPGRASTDVATPGTPDYVDTSYVDDYQSYTGTIIGIDTIYPGGPTTDPLPGVMPPPPVTATPPVSPPSGDVTLPPPLVPKGPFSIDPVPPPLSEPLQQIGYTPPVEQIAIDDGIVFPAGKRDLVLASEWHGVPSILNPGNIEAYNLQIEAAIIEATNNVQPISLPPPPPSSDFSGTVQSLNIHGEGPNYAAIDAQVQQAVLKSVYQGTGLWYGLVLKPLDTGPFAASYVVSTTPLILPKTIDLSAPSLGG